MRLTKIYSIAAFILGASTTFAQTTNVPFSTSDAGKSLPINWGMDTAWDDLYNVNWGIAHYGPQFQTGRISFQPYELVDTTKINNKSANFGLPLKMARKLQQRIDRIKLTGTTKVNINCDHEVLTRKLDDYGNYGSAEDNVGKGNYVSTSNGLDQTYVKRWKDLIKASVKYAQTQGLEVVSVSPFNEPDYGWNQYYKGTPGVNTTNQYYYGMRDFLAIAKAIKADEFFATGEGKDVRVCGPNTLNCDRALPWYNYSGMAAAIQEANTHQLAGSFKGYADFFTKARQDGKVATGDELHNVGEAIAGVEYGMQNGIWWAFDAKARGQFMHDSNEGVRIGYAEDRTHWTVAAVYRNEKDNEIHGFIGSSERQANSSTYNFQCTDRQVFFNGYGPLKEWTVTTKGGTGYQQGQINYEYLFDITYGDDVQLFPIDGNYQLMNASDLKVIATTGAGNNVNAAKQTNRNTQRWHIYPDPNQKSGDCSYWFIDNLGDANQHLNLCEGNLNAGAKVITYNAGHDALEQWYFRYVKDGYFHIMTRQSNKYLYANGSNVSLEEGPDEKTTEAEKLKYMWRIIPSDAPAKIATPSIPTKLISGELTSTAVSMAWQASEESGTTYNVLRLEENGWNTVARCLPEPSFTDTSVESGKSYNYKVQAVDYSCNRSLPSASLNIIVPKTDGSTVTDDYSSFINKTTIAQEGYQDILLPNGLYKLTANVSQQKDGNAVLYAETYRCFETTLSADESTESIVEDILVTDNTIRIGIKASENGSTLTADNFKLTQISKTENTAISHYTNAIAYLDEMTDIELLRYINHDKLSEARMVAHNCEENATAYEIVITNYAEALHHAQATAETTPVIGEDLSELLPEVWAKQTGYYGDAAERDNGNTTPFYSGRVLYQEISDLIPGALYKIDFYAVACLRSLDAQKYSGEGIAYVFANDVEEDIYVYTQTTCNIESYPHTLICAANAKGKIVYGIGNRKAGGQWYVAKSKSMSFVGYDHTATLSCNAAEYSTFVAPYEVTLPDGITAFTIESINGSALNLAEASNGNILEANKPVIIFNNTDTAIGQTYNGSTTSLNDVTDGYLVGLLHSDRIIPFNAFVMQGDGETQNFYKIAETTHGIVNRCYINKNATIDNADATVFELPVQKTSILEVLNNTKHKTPSIVYDLSGRKIDLTTGSSTLKKGIYIINGQKVMK